MKKEGTKALTVQEEKAPATKEETPATEEASAKKTHEEARCQKDGGKERDQPEERGRRKRREGGVREFMKKFTTRALEEELSAKLMLHFGKTAEEALPSEMMRACALALRDVMALREVETRKKTRKEQKKQVHYLSLEISDGPQPDEERL